MPPSPQHLSNILLLLMLIYPSVFYGDHEISPIGVAKVNKIILDGLSRTHKKVVLRELRFHEGDEIRSGDIIESIQDLKNLELFSEIHPFIHLQKDKSINVEIKLKEKWTTIPYFSYAEGGSTTHLRGGAYDINVFGRFVELGAEYENLNGSGSGFFWYRNRRLFNERIGLLLVGGTHARPRKIYTPNADLEYEYGHYQVESRFTLDKEINADLTVGFGLRYTLDEFIETEKSLPIPLRYQDQLIFNEKRESITPKLYIALGKLNFDSFLVQGREYSLTIERSYSDHDEFNYTRFTSDNKFFYPLRWQGNLASRILISTINTNSLHRINYIGGLSHVRGYYDGQFIGSSYWQANLEYRIPSLVNSWFTIQNILFFDIAQVKNRFAELDLSGDDTYSSYGIGIRLISPRIYRFNARLDIAVTDQKTGASAISMGAQQFF